MRLFLSFLQLVDDLLDFVSSEQEMGKPTAADLHLGLATAPVLFAAQEVRESWFDQANCKVNQDNTLGCS